MTQNYVEELIIILFYSYVGYAIVIKMIFIKYNGDHVMFMIWSCSNAV